MNYRHSFHAGNFADVMKHVLLARILTHLNAKETPYRVIDLHGGAGLYDLSSDDAQTTSEWRDGVGRMAWPFVPEAEALLQPWRDALAFARRIGGDNAYPGSPLIARALMRRNDRLIVVEKQERTFRRLQAALGSDPRAKALELDASIALRANIPPPERRGLVLADPPFERADEFELLVKDVVAAHAKWSTGIQAIWYPVRNDGRADAFVGALLEAGLKRMLRMELRVAGDDNGLGACGLLVLNPPWRLADEAQRLLPLLAERLARDARVSYRCDPLLPDG